jgi:iron(III) transport system substrate-binding protein
LAAASPAAAKPAAPVYKKAPDELVAAARKEGKVRFSSALEPREVQELIGAFKAAYPGIEVSYNRTGVGEDEKILLAMKAGTYEWDVLSIQSETFPSYRNADAMASYKWTETFGTEPRIVHPAGTIVATGNQLAGIAYNTNLVPANKVPKSWDDCADPFFNGKKLWDVRPNPLIANWAYWGEEKTLDYVRRVKDGSSFVRGNTQAYTMLAAGEAAIYCGGNYGPFTRFKQSAPTAPIEMAFPEGPLLGQPALEYGVLKGSPNQNAAILLLGWMSTDGLQYLKETGRDSFFHPASNLGQLAARLKREVNVYDWSYWERGDQIQNRILQEWGFPKSIN